MIIIYREKKLTIGNNLRRDLALGEDHLRLIMMTMGMGIWIMIIIIRMIIMKMITMEMTNLISSPGKNIPA